MKMDDTPLVSIICISMNHARYVEQGVRSFVEQTYHNIEFLYLDNASADNTYEIATANFEASGCTYKAYKREWSYNLPANLNFLIEKATGKYLCFISCDDWMKPGFISAMVTQYEKHPEVGLLYTNGWYFYEDRGNYEIAENKNFISGKIFDRIFLNGIIFPIGIMIKQEAIEKIGLYDESIGVEDYDFWLRIAKEFEIGYQSQPLVYYRKHSKSMSSFEGYKNIPMYLKIAEKYKTHPLYKQVCRNLRKHVIMGYVSTGHYKKAIMMGLKDFRMERFYFSVSLQLIKKFFRIREKQNL